MDEDGFPAQILENAQMIVLQPGDLLVIVPGCDMKMEQIKASSEVLKHHLPGTPIFFAPRGTTFAAIRPVDQKAFAEDIKKIEEGLR